MTPTHTIDEPTTALANTPQWTGIDVPPVTSPKLEQLVTDHMNLAKAFQTKVKDFFKPHKDRAYTAWKALCASESEILAGAVESESRCKAALGTYQLRLQAERDAERRRLEEVARVEEEQRRVVEAARLEEEARRNPDPVEAQHQLREAEEIIAAPACTPPVFVDEAPKAKGTTYKDKWVTTGTSKARFLQHLVDHPDLLTRPEVVAVLEFDTTNLRRLGEMAKKEGEIYPGIYVKKEINVSGRTR